MSPQRPEKSAELIAARKLGFDILSDDGNKVADTFGLRFIVPDDVIEIYRGFGLDLEASNGDPSWTLPIPARYIVDSDSLVRYARIDVDYTVRPEPDETVDALRALVS